MCYLCRTKPVYEFTNQRKLCKNCFIQWFQKKFLFTIRKFKMIKRGDVVNIRGNNDFKKVVLKYLLGILEEKGVIEIGSLHSQYNCSQQPSSSCSLRNKLDDNKFSKRKIMRDADLKQHYSKAKRGVNNKIAITSTLDSEANEIIETLIKGNEKEMKNLKPVDGKMIKPLYLFLNEEVLLYAKLKDLKFDEGKEKKTKIRKFINELEKKHPEVKRAVVNSYLKLNVK